MRTLKLISMACIAGAMFVTASVQAATVTFSNISATDGNDLTGFDVAATIAGNAGGSDTLSLGVSPFDIAGTGGMIDTMLLTITADNPGEKLTTITYTESGVIDAPTGFGGASVQLIATSGNNSTGPMPGFVVLGAFDGVWGPVVQVADVSAWNVSEIQISVMNSLFAGGANQVAKEFGTLKVDTAPIPVPPAVWLFGSAIAGLIAVRRRNA